jgi:nicotinamide mononucleotide transporter
LLEAAITALAAVTPTEWVAVGLALGYLVLAIRQNAWCWAFSIASSALYLVLFARAGLVMQAALQVFFVAMSLYGWYAWKGGDSRPPVAVRRWPARRHVLAIGAVLLAAVVNGLLIARSGSPWLVPFADAAIAWGSVLTTWLVARKLLENWLYWIVIDVAAAALYWSQGLHATAGLYGLYSVLAWRGYRAWQDDERVRAVAHA